MEIEEWEDAGVCIVCGARVSEAAQDAFGFGTENVLCWECATERGGRYDAERDTWDVEPDLEGLVDEAYGSAPHEERHR